MSAEQRAAEARLLGTLIAAADNQASGEEGWQRQGEERLLRAFSAERQTPLPWPDGHHEQQRRDPRKSALSRATRSVQRMALAAVVTTVISAVVVWSRSPRLLFGDSAVSFVTPSRSGETRFAGRVSATTGQEVLSFSDGSTVRLDRGGVLRVRDTSEHGATLVVERGTVQSTIVHEKDTSWSLLAGPYEVKVIGTRFTTTWEPEQGEFAVELHEGEVHILGAGIEETVNLHAGQGFFAHQSGDWRVSPLEEQPRGVPKTASKQAPVEKSAGTKLSADVELTADDPPDGAGDRPGAEKVVKSEPLRANSVSPSGGSVSERQLPEPASLSWGKLVAQGKFASVLEAARAKGQDACLSSCTPSELRAWGDAARYSGQTSVAREILLRLRSVAPSERSRAGYLLGSLAESRGQWSSALSWYRKYLVESGGGALTSEAHAGVMRCLLSLGKEEEAKRAAGSYLEKFPGGVGAKVARQILRDR